MRTALRLVSGAAVAALVLGLAFGVGTLTGAPAWSAAAARPTPAAAAPPVAAPPQVTAAPAADPNPNPLGLAATAAGYTLVAGETTFVPGRASPLTFTVTGPDRRPVTAFDTVDEQPMHVVVVRRDAAGWQHLRPALGPNGEWRVPLALPAPGIYRFYADFVPTGGPPLVLGTDLFAAGQFAPIPFGPSRVAQIDGYQVRLDGDLVAGSASQVFATVSRNGTGVTDLQPVLGGFGHLVALRRSDLAYVLLRPDAAAAPDDRSGPGIAFTARLPSPGGYRLFLDFRHGGGVHTAEFTVDTRDDT